MNPSLASLITLFSTGNTADLTKHLASLSNTEAALLIQDLLSAYANDRNSSTIREFVTVSVAGYTHSDGKIGFDGVKTENGITKECEAKPRNIRSADVKAYKEGTRKTKPALLDAGGSVNDYTLARFEKDKRENPTMLMSGFVDGKLIFILSIPFNSPGIITSLETQLTKRFPNGAAPSQYLRGARVCFKDYKDDAALKVEFIAQKSDIEANKPYISKPLYDYLHAKA
ncbi:hypothetical protein K2Y00_01000 [Patescibacteria group bacterium]|nr:hypothetical protein [Patescibacteria group bacterium]